VVLAKLGKKITFSSCSSKISSLLSLAFLSRLTASAFNSENLLKTLKGMWK